MIKKFFRLFFASSLSLLAAATLTTPGLTQGKKLNSIALTVGDLGNPFFVQIQHGVADQAKQYNPSVIEAYQIGSLTRSVA